MVQVTAIAVQQEIELRCTQHCNTQLSLSVEGMAKL